MKNMNLILRTVKIALLIGVILGIIKLYSVSFFRNGKHTFSLIRQGVIQELLNRSLFL